MRTQLVGWFLCVLLCSSFAHDWLRGQDSILEAKSRQLNRVDSKLLDNIRNFQKTFAEKKESQVQDIQPRIGGSPVKYYCPSNNPYIIVIANVAANKAIVIDLLNLRFLLCDGNTGTGLLYNVASGLCCYVPVGAWKVSVVALINWVSLVNLIAIEQLSTNIVVNVTSPSLIALTLCKNVIGSLDTDLYIKVSANINASLILAISLCTEIITSLKVNLAGLIKFTTIGYVTIQGQLIGFVEICRGLIDLFVTANLNVQDVVNAAVILDISEILQAPEGLTCFAYVAGKIGLKFDLAVYLNVVITNITVFMRICVRLGGNVYVGVNGVFRAVAAVIALTDDVIAIDTCLLIILNVCANISGQLEIKAAINSIQDLLTAQINLWDNELDLITIIDFISELDSDTCIIANVDISLIITILCTGVITTVLDLCIDVVVCITAYTTASISVHLYYATFFRVTLFLLNDISGRLLINIIIPGLNIPISYTNICLNLLSGLLLDINLVSFVLNILGLVSAITLVPILTNIYNPCFNVILARTGLNLKSILKAQSAVGEYNRISVWMGNINNCGC